MEVGGLGVLPGGGCCMYGGLGCGEGCIYEGWFIGKWWRIGGAWGEGPPRVEGCGAPVNDPPPPLLLTRAFIWFIPCIGKSGLS